MLKHNGVRFNQDTFQYFKSNQYWVESSISFLAFGNPTGTELINDSQCYRKKDLIAFGLNEFGNYICFDYSKHNAANNPSIVIMYYDQFIVDEVNNPKMIVLPVSHSFDDFLEMLYEDV